MTGMIGSMTIIFAIAIAGVYHSLLKRSLGALAPNASMDIVFRVTDDCFIVTSPTSESRLSWVTIKKVWRFKDLWLLFVGPSKFVMLPTAVLSDDIESFIVDKIRAGGGRVD